MSELSDHNLIDPAEAARRHAEGALFVDVRRPEARVENGVLPAALAVAKIEVSRRFGTESDVDHDRDIVVFCSSERGSGPVVDTLAELGYTRVSHIHGGFGAWKEQGFETTPHDA